MSNNLNIFLETNCYDIADRKKSNVFLMRLLETMKYDYVQLFYLF